MSEMLSDLIGSIYEAALQPHLWGEVLCRITIYAPGVSATIYAHDRVARTPMFHHSYGTDPVYVALYAERWAASNPIIEALAVLEPGEVAGLAAILDYGAFSRTPFFLEWGRPQHLCDAINLVLERTPTRIACVSIHRRDEHGLADEASVERVRLLAPHLLRAVKIGRVLEQAAVEAGRFAAVLDALADAVMLIDAGGHIVHANTAAHVVMRAGVSLPAVARRDRPHERHSKPPMSLRGEAAGDVTLTQDRKGRRYVAHVLPLHGNATTDTSAMRLVSIRAVDETAAAVANAGKVFGLTARERDVLFCLAEVGGVPAIAATLGILDTSVRSHLQSLFEKTGSNRQADLVAMLAGFASPFAVCAASEQDNPITQKTARLARSHLPPKKIGKT